MNTKTVTDKAERKKLKRAGRIWETEPFARARRIFEAGPGPPVERKREPAAQLIRRRCGELQPRTPGKRRRALIRIVGPFPLVGVAASAAARVDRSAAFGAASAS